MEAPLHPRNEPFPLTCLPGHESTPMPSMDPNSTPMPLIDPNVFLHLVLAMNNSGQQSPPHVTPPAPTVDEPSGKRYLSVGNMRPPFKKARYASQIKNYDFTMKRIRERAQREVSLPQSPLAANPPPPAELALSPTRSYEQLMTQHQLALMQAQQQHNPIASPTNLGDIGVLQQQQTLEIARLGGLTKDLNMSQFVSPDNLVPGGYPTAGQYGMLQWHTSQLAKNFLGPNAVNHMIEHLACSRVEDRGAIGSCDVVGDEEAREHRAAQQPRDAPASHNLYDNLECGSTSGDCETGDEESDDIRGGEEFYGDGAAGGPLQLCDSSLVFHQQLALAHMQNFRLQAAKATAELHQARLQTTTDDARNAQVICDDSVCDRRRVGRVNIPETDTGPLQGVASVGADKIYCNLKCDCNCECKMPSPNIKDSKPANEPAKFNASAISNISMPIKTDTGYPKA